MPNQTGSTHGGARAGAGRPPRALTYSEHADAIEQTIVDALPSIVEKMIQMAMDGDLKAARYLIDRILGRVARATSPAAQTVGASHGEPSEPTGRPRTGDPCALSTKPAPSKRMTLEELQEAAFGPKTKSTLEIIKRDPIAWIDRKHPPGRLNFAGAHSY
jgi:hypothetical protein